MRTIFMLLPLVPAMIALQALAQAPAPPPATQPAAPDNPAKVYDWLQRQQSPSGILGNEENDTFAGLYTNALAAICFIHQGDIDRAQRVFQFYQQHYDECFAPGTPGGYPQFADAGTGKLHMDTDRWIGDNAWLLIALNYYQRQTGRKDFAAMSQGVARWLISLQTEQGGVMAGFNKNGPMTHYSTEGNLDCYAALVDYPENRQRIRAWLDREMWVPQEHRYKMGSTVSESALDCCSWAIAALGGHADTLDYTERKFLYTDNDRPDGVPLTLFRDYAEKSRIWFEGSGEMVLAYELAGRPDEAHKYLAAMNHAMIPSKRFPGLVGLPCFTRDPSWTTAATRIFVPSQTWYLLASWRFNPMATP